MRKATLGLIGLVVLTPAVFAQRLVTDLIEPDGTWALGQAQLPYLPAGSGLTPTAGQMVMHFNAGGDTASYGTSFVQYTNELAAGTYIVRIDVGSFTNRPIAAVGAIGLTAGGQLLSPQTSAMPLPAQGEFKTWVFVYYSATATNQPIGFSITVPYTGEQRNVAFDNLRIDFAPGPATLVLDPIEADGTWTLGQAELAYLPAGSGLSPTIGQVMMHFNAGGDANAYGTSSVTYTNVFAPGLYLARIDVGSFTNRPLAAVGAIGLTAGGNLLTPESVSNPTPAQGQWKTWVFTYTNPVCSQQPIGFRISVPYTGEHRNIAFDNLQIQFLPSTDVLCASIYHAVEIAWNSQANKRYQVQWSPSASPTNWYNLGVPVTGTGSNISVFDSTRGQSEKLYRVEVLP